MCVSYVESRLSGRSSALGGRGSRIVTCKGKGDLAAMSVRGTRVQEFLAHEGDVTCLYIGRKSAGVLVTGGDDKKVNVWLIGKPQPLLSLQGHQSRVECVTLDRAEEVVVAGSQGGTVKLWDLEEARAVRTLTGHRTSCCAIDFHPFGEFVASGSQDTQVKLWDLRRRGCIHTYKAHAGAINQVRFSPDGRWVATGSDSGAIHVWDLTAGRLWREFTAHRGAVHALEFHPTDILLASGSQDRTVRLWDVDPESPHAGPVDVCGPDTLPVRALVFSPDGDAVLGATSEGCRSWAWEPSTQLGIVDAPWGNVRDMVLRNSRVIACAARHGSVGLWALDVAGLGGFAPGAGDASAGSPGRPQRAQGAGPLSAHGGAGPSGRDHAGTPKLAAAPAPSGHPGALPSGRGQAEVGPPGESMPSESFYVMPGVAPQTRAAQPHTRPEAPAHASHLRESGHRPWGRQLSARGYAGYAPPSRDSDIDAAAADLGAAEDRRTSRSQSQGSRPASRAAEGGAEGLASREGSGRTSSVRTTTPPEGRAGGAVAGRRSGPGRAGDVADGEGGELGQVMAGVAATRIGPRLSAPLPGPRGEVGADGGGRGDGGWGLGGGVGAGRGDEGATDRPRTTGAGVVDEVGGNRRGGERAEVTQSQVARSAVEMVSVGIGAPGDSLMANGSAGPVLARLAAEAASAGPRGRDGRKWMEGRAGDAAVQGQAQGPATSHDGAHGPWPLGEEAFRPPGDPGTAAGGPGAGDDDLGLVPRSISGSRPRAPSAGRRAAGLAGSAGYADPSSHLSRGGSAVAAAPAHDLSASPPPARPRRSLSGPRSPTVEVRYPGMGVQGGPALPRGAMPQGAGLWDGVDDLVRGGAAAGVPVGDGAGLGEPWNPGMPGSGPRSASEELKASLRALMDKHATVKSILASRLGHLEVVRGFWQRGDARGAVQAARRAGDLSVGADLLSVMAGARKSAISLDVVLEAIPLLQGLLRSPHVRFANIALDFSMAVLASPLGDHMRAVHASPLAAGVDLSGEERRDRLLRARGGFVELASLVAALAQSGSEAAGRASDALPLFDRL